MDVRAHWVREAFLHTDRIRSAAQFANVGIGAMPGESDAMNSPIGTFNSSPCERTTARSMKFASSRTFPLQGWFVNSSIVLGGIVVICLPISLESFETK